MTIDYFTCLVPLIVVVVNVFDIFGVIDVVAYLNCRHLWFIC